jgi:hypothetical protein
MSPRGFPRLPWQIPSRVPQSPQGDVRVYGELWPRLCGALALRIPLAVHIGGLDPELSPLRLPLPLTLPAESLRPS